MCYSTSIDPDLNRIAKRFQAEIDSGSFEFALKKSKEEPRKFKWPKLDGRIFPNYYAPVVMKDGKTGRRVLRPMRYRLRPAWAEKEIPSKYNLFNARLDSLEKRRSWKGIFGKNHGIFPFLRFFEWVEDENGKKVQISFYPGKRELMWAPCLWDVWVSEDRSEKIPSFALITDDPPREVAEMGHDRCPIFLKESLIEDWLSPEGRSREELFQILKNKESVTYQNEWVAA